MTNSYASSHKLPRLILIHGMNNNLECFYPFRNSLKAAGFPVEMIVLPNHGESRDEVKDLEEALVHFDHSLSSLVNEPYVVVAFSQGAQYFQLWLKRFKHRRPDSLVLLAPAVFINYRPLLDPLFHFFPRAFYLSSRMPKLFRRYDRLFFWEYRLLFSGVEAFKSGERLKDIPTIVLIDPKDELVNAKRVQEYYKSLGARLVLIQRKGLAKGLGQHHIIFHPDYYSEGEWRDFFESIVSHLKIEA